MKTEQFAKLYAIDNDASKQVLVTKDYSATDSSEVIIMTVSSGSTRLSMSAGYDTAEERDKAFEDIGYEVARAAYLDITK